jgi:Ca2+/Na+ antiporter
MAVPVVVIVTVTVVMTLVVPVVEVVFVTTSMSRAVLVVVVAVTAMMAVVAMMTVVTVMTVAALTVVSVVAVVVTQGRHHRRTGARRGAVLGEHVHDLWHLMLHGSSGASPTERSECDQQHRGERCSYGGAERAVMDLTALSLDSLRQRADESGSWLGPPGA